MLMIKGKKMSKSKGNWIILRNAIEDYGADSTRCALLLGAEGMADPDWRSENVRDIMDKLESLIRLIETIAREARNEEHGWIENWLLSVLQKKTKTVTNSMESLKTRTALETALFEIWNDFRWYIRRKGDMKAKALREALDIWIRLLSPFIPHICEELWKKVDGKGFVSLAEWPKYDVNVVNPLAEENETLVKSVLEDTLNIIQATKRKPKNVYFYTASEWKWEVYKKALAMSLKGNLISQRDLMKTLMKNEEMKKKADKIARFSSQIMDEINRTGRNRKEDLQSLGTMDEIVTLKEAKNFLTRELKAEIEVFREDDEQKFDPENRARLAKPYRPAIYIR